MALRPILQVIGEAYMPSGAMEGPVLSATILRRPTTRSR
jgi:hypothetical protein